MSVMVEQHFFKQTKLKLQSDSLSFLEPW